MRRLSDLSTERLRNEKNQKNSFMNLEQSKLLNLRENFYIFSSLSSRSISAPYITKDHLTSAEIGAGSGGENEMNEKSILCILKNY